MKLRSAFVRALLSALILLLLITPAFAQRSLTLISPNGGEWFEPGETVQIRWTPGGTGWQSSDTVKLEVSSNGGSSWSKIQGANKVDYNAASYPWTVPSSPTSSYYRIRVTFNGDNTVTDTSDSVFTVANDTSVPSITHTPIPHTDDLTGPYQICATVMDNQGIASVTLFWSRNGGAFSQVQMTQTGAANEYAGDIPGPSRIGDSLCYYIEARDTSLAGNISRYPSGAPAATNCFNIDACGTDILAEAQGGWISSPHHAFGNTFQCTTPSRLTKIEHYIDIQNTTDIRFFVYESTSLNGTYQKVYEYDLVNPPAGSGWYGTPEIDVQMTAGRYYIIGAAFNANSYFYCNMSAHPINTSFGQTMSGYRNPVFPPPDTTTRGSDSYAYRQRLTSCREPRALMIIKPNGGECFDPGSIIEVQWAPYCPNWESSDTVKLEYSSDAGASWNPIPGAASLPYNAGTFDWNTTGLPLSPNYLIKVTFNGDASINDTSDAAFNMQVDTTAPVIVHTRLANTGSTGPFTVTATVTDDLTGVGTVTLYYSRNGGAYISVPMLLGTEANSFSAEIPSGAAGDRFCYYITAVDRSSIANLAVEPAGAPGTVHCFDVTICAADIFDQYDNGITCDGVMCGNVYLCESSAVLTEFEHSVTQANRLFVYESSSQNGPFNKVWGGYAYTTSYTWRNSGPITLKLTRGRYYFIGAWSTTSYSSSYFKDSAQPWAVNFGHSILGVHQAYTDDSFLPLTFNLGVNDSGPDVFNQKLTSCLVPRDVILGGPNGGQWYQPGDIVPVTWDTSGPGWKAGETVRVEYSLDGGSSWSLAPGGESIPYNSGSFEWNTTGVTESDNCKVRVVSTVDPTSFDASETPFVIMTDAVLPVITHTPLGDTGNLTGPYQIIATITDNYGLTGAALHWSKNGGAFSAVTMTEVPGKPNEYIGEIPGPAKLGDSFCYYIEAADRGGNIALAPSDAPANLYCFTVVDCATDQIGGKDINRQSSGYLEGNSFLCTATSLLTCIEQYIGETQSDELYFVVYELDDTASTYNKIFSKMVFVTDYNEGWKSSGPVSVWLKQGKRYAIGVLTRDYVKWFYQGISVKPVTSLGWMEGRIEKSTGSSSTPPTSITDVTIDHTTACYQKLSSCRIPLEILQPNGREILQAGETVQVNWRAAGLWQPDDTVRLECSTDAGANWTAITGAESLHYDSGSFDWNTSGLAGSHHYLVRVVSNRDPSLSDRSDGTFSIFSDTTAPLIVHTPLVDTDQPSYYEVKAVVTDNYTGVDQVTLYWRKNGDELRSAAMALSAGEYKYTLPVSATTVGDVFEYYILATDKALTPNEGRHPAEGFHRFTRLPMRDRFTEEYGGVKYNPNPNNLDGISITFTPNGSSDFYGACVKPILNLPTDPSGGTQLALPDNGFEQIMLSGGAQVSIYGTSWNSLYVNANGNITFTEGDAVYHIDPSYHFNKKRVSGFFTDLNPADGGTVSWKQMDDRVAVTFENVKQKNSANANTFQMEMFFDGRIRLSYLEVTATFGVAGLSDGSGYLSYVPMSDLRNYPLCCTGSIRVQDSFAPVDDGEMPFGMVGPGNVKTGQVTISNPSGCDMLIKDIRPAMYAENFDDGLAQGWQMYGDGQWSASSGELILDEPAASTGNFHTAMYTGATFDKFYCELKVRRQHLSGIMFPSYGFLIVRASPDFQISPAKGSAFIIGIDDYNRSFVIHKQVNGYNTYIPPISPYDTTPIYQSPLANTLAVDASGSRLRFYINGTLVADIAEAAPLSGKIGVIGTIGNPGATVYEFDDLMVSPPLGQTGPLNGFNLSGVPTLPMMLAPGESVSFGASYSPQTTGSSRAWTRIYCLGGDRNTVDIDMTGTGGYASSMAQAKSLPDGYVSALSSVVVSAVFDGRFYVQDEGRTGGIGVIWEGSMPSEGDTVTVVGNLIISRGERLIKATEVGPAE